MLNPFPELFTYSMLAPFFIRIVIGFIFINLGEALFKSERKTWVSLFETLRIPKPEISTKIFGAVEFIIGLMFFVGFYTQIAALLAIFITLIESYLEYKESSMLKRDIAFYLLLLAISLSLLFSGAGAFAIDIPL